MHSKSIRALGIAGACGALLAGCETAKEIGAAAGAGAMDGFYGRIFEESSYADDGTAPSTVGSGGGGWGKAWTPSGRGVGVAPRSLEAPEPRACGAIDDEFGLYQGDALRAVQAAVRTHNGSLTRAQYTELAGSGTRLSGARAGGVIGVVETDQGHTAKFVVQWPESADPRLVTIEVANATGQVVRTADSLDLAPRMAVDLDSPAAGGAFDLMYGPEPATRTPTLAAASGAGLSFVSGSLCE